MSATVIKESLPESPTPQITASCRFWIEHINEEVNQENSNKNPVINSTQRDYMAGEVSKDLSKRVLLPEEIVEAHEAGNHSFP